MTAGQFYNLVHEMRCAQRAYFTAAKKADAEAKRKWIAESIRLEAAVDAEIERAFRAAVDVS